MLKHKNIFEDAFEECSSISTANTIWVAYSGGVDSTVLLLSLNDFCKRNARNTTIKALHINHNLQVDADKWQKHCQSICQEHEIPIICESVTIEKNNASLENSARQSRYAIYQKYVEEKDILLTAHHLDDQAETLLLRLIRGSGNHGATAIPKQRSLKKGRIIRPFLHIEKQDILAYAKSNNISWIEDTSNLSFAHDRNYLRHEILPKIAKRHPHYLKSFDRFIQNNIESVELLEDVAKDDLAGIDFAKRIFPIETIISLSFPRKKNALRFWIQKQGLKLPSSDKMNKIIFEVIEAKEDASPCLILSDYQVRRHKNNLYFLDKFDSIKANTTFNIDDLATIVINKDSSLLVSKKIGKDLLVAKHKYQIQFRSGKEKVYLGERRSLLKKMLNAWAIPSWAREYLPLIYARGELVCIPGYYLHPDYRTKDEQYGFKLDWHHNYY